MKRFILASLLAAFACAVSVQAGEDCCEKTCDKAKAKVASTASACCAKEAKAKVAARKAPEKGAMLLVRR